MRKKSLEETLYPSLFKMPIAAIFALAPTGVKLPPRVAPINNPKYRTYGSTPIEFAMPCTTGNIVATYGILSTKAEIMTDTNTIIVYITNTELPPTFTKSSAIASITPASVIPAITVNKPINRSSVLKSIA